MATMAGPERSGSHRFACSRFSRMFLDRVHFRAGIPLQPLMNLGVQDVLYSPDFTVPHVRGAMHAATIHDLAWEVAPDFTPPGLKRFLSSVVPNQIARADAIFTVSETSRRDIIDRYGVTADKIVVATNGVSEEFFADELDEADEAIPDLPVGYLLMVGTIEPRKNHLGVLRAIELIPDAPLLVIVGNPGWAHSEILHEVRCAEVDGKVKALGFVPDTQLRSLYARASAVICASWYEGFDLPLLEAFATGASVAASDIPVHREIAGDMVHYFDPGDVDSIADGIIQAIHCQSGRTIRQNRAGAFTWDASARIVGNTIQRLAGRQPW
ncbi:N/A [soil metagenome]